MTNINFAWPITDFRQSPPVRAGAERTVQERCWFILGAMDGLDGRVGVGEGWPVGERDPQAQVAYQSGYEAGKRYKTFKEGMV